MRAPARDGEDMEALKRINCEEAVRQFYAYLDRALSGDSIDALEAHLAACLDCCDQLEFSRQFDAFVRRRLAGAALPRGLEQRIRRGIRVSAARMTREAG